MQYTKSPFYNFTAISLLLLTACSVDATSNTVNNITSETQSCDAGIELGQSDAGLAITTLCIDIKNDGVTQSTKRFEVEIAKSAEEQARGLMFRTELNDDKGMVFPYPSARPLSFWMKNTVISLDIIFINEDGSIANIARNTEPYSLESVSSINPAIAVLEVRAGLTQELNIKAGDIIRWQ